MLNVNVFYFFTGQYSTTVLQPGSKLPEFNLKEAESGIFFYQMQYIVTSLQNVSASKSDKNNF
jgi:hypothetical protein